jgi:WD40 repeat protein
VSHIEFVGNSSIVTAAGRTITRWNFKSGQKEKEWKGHQDTILALSVNSKVCVSGGDDGVGLVFSLE